MKNLVKSATWLSILLGKKNQRMAEIGRIGGLKGGRARANNLSVEELSAIGKSGAAARWRRAR